MSRFTDYADAVRSGLVMVWRIDLLSSDGRVLATTEPLPEGSTALRWAAQVEPISWANDRMSSDNATLTVAVTDPKLIPENAGTLLHPDTGNLVRVDAGVRKPDGSFVYWTVGTYAIFAAEVLSEMGVAALTVSLVDRARPLESEIESAITFSNGATVESVVQRLCDQVLTGPFRIAATGFTLPAGSIEPGASRFDVVDQMLGGCGHELAVGTDGLVFSQPIPETTGGNGERWVYGDEGYPVGSLTRSWSSKTPQAWRIEGGSFQNTEEPVTFTVYDTDPHSQGYYDGQKPPQVRSSRFAWVRTRTQAAAAGYGQIRRHGVGRMVVRFRSAPNPAMRVHDLVELKDAASNVDGVFRVIGVSVPVHADAQMEVVARHVWDPQVNYQGVGSEGAPEGAVGSISDDFNRANQNLEDTNEGGSINWTEFGWSWAVVGEKAVQRYSNGWAFARHNSPLTGSDQFAEIVVGPTSGRQVGPMIRSDGEYNGISALAGSDGTISVVSWRNGKQAATLGTYRHGSGLSGSTVRISGSGSTVAVSVNGSQVLSVDAGEASHHGTYVGMVAYGGHGTQAPTADNFLAAVA